MEPIEILGFIAGSFSAGSLLPQLIKSWTTKSTKDISLLWTISALIAQVLWIIYGVAVDGISLIVTSAMVAVMSLILLVLKIRYG